MALFFAMPEEGEKDIDIDIDKAIEEFDNYGYSELGAAVFAMNPIYFNSKTAEYKYKDENNEINDTNDGKRVIMETANKMLCKRKENNV